MCHMFQDDAVPLQHLSSKFHTVGYKPTAGKWPHNKQLWQQLLVNASVHSMFLGKKQTKK
jgi:hypothetical protein